MEKIVKKRSLADFRDRANPWRISSYEQRLAAMAEICEPNQQHGANQSGFPRVYRITRKPRG
jgi:hypothetical protein